MKTHFERNLSPVKPMPALFRLLDLLLVPVMRALGVGSELPQETHRWHCQAITANDLVDETLALTIDGDDPSPRSNKIFPLPLFHMPVFGGWTRYVVVEVLSDISVWHIGWVHTECPPGFKLRSAIQRLPIRTRKIRMLKLPHGNRMKLFALAPDGTQLACRASGEGFLGDARFPFLRLF